MARYAIALTVLMLLAVNRAGKAQTGDDPLPAPPDARAIAAQALYHLALFVNYRDSGIIAEATRRNGRFYLRSADLQRAGIPARYIPNGNIDPDSIVGVRSEYDAPGQRLLLTVPQSWLPHRQVALGESRPRYHSVSGRGALLNYDIYASRARNGDARISAWHEARMFAPSGTLNATGTLSGRDGGGQGGEGYRRYDTWFTSTDDERAIRWSVGDVVTDALSWSNSVRMGGVSYGRDFSLRPDIVTYPLPAFSGEAALPSSVDIFINGYRNGGARLQPGPFTLTNLPYVNGAGEAVLVTTDTLGRQVSTTLPFYVASDLLRPGLSDGMVSLGALRRRYGVANFDYGAMGGSGSWRYGVTPSWTLETHAEGAPSLALGGLGSRVKLGRWGIANGALAYSDMRGEAGHQTNWGWQYTTQSFSLATQHSRRQRTYGNLARYETVRAADTGVPLVGLSRSASQYSLSLNLKRYGSLGAAWIDVQGFDASRTRLMNLSWSKTLWGNSSLYLSGGRESGTGGWNMALVIQLSPGIRDSVAVTMEHTPASGDTQRVNYSRAMPTDGGLGWDVALARQEATANYQQGTLRWRNNHIQLQGGVYGQRGAYTQWGEMSGALVAMDNRLFTANQINDAFVVVSTDGEPAVKVNYEHQPVGITDNKGYLLVSGVASSYPGLYSIDALNLPVDIAVKKTEQRLALRRHGGYVLRFPLKRQRAANIILHDSAGQAVPLSSRVSGVAGGDAIVGYEGIAWLTGLERRNALTVTAPDGRRCRVQLALPASDGGRIHTYGPLECRWQEAR
ncbi:fimbria/pilus outer membrane usher protein [Erwinia sp. HR93]|uniref:fimbria/pilus outer membrane usher protein n=1 Tax=Erwinia sp. HR93 TaxID=3094840 RepID=UPI002ADEC2B4|nr:fimbria/pilus outer membrane usher protein [Erwinia sp. HR93]MEA1064098.1 fimbria/pilus outer membrane usher protein [Erwinia sp. HR93]